MLDDCSIHTIDTFDHGDASFRQPALALACSPRAGGNSDTLAMAFGAGFEQEYGQGMRIEYLRNYAIKPCIACYACEQNKQTTRYKPCPLGRDAKLDQAEQLFHMLMHAPALYISAPIFFYHLPAHLKAFVDRGQSYWLRRMAEDEELTSLPVRAARPAWLSLVAARPRGQKLFEGSIVSLRFFLHIFNFILQEPETLLGYDAADAVKNDASMMAQTVDYGQRAARALVQNTWRR